MCRISRVDHPVEDVWRQVDPSPVAQQLSGTDALFYNYVKAADAVGFSRLWKVYATLVGFGTCKLITAFASMYLLDTVGTCVEIKFWAPHTIELT